MSPWIKAKEYIYIFAKENGHVRLQDREEEKDGYCLLSC